MKKSIVSEPVPGKVLIVAALCFPLELLSKLSAYLVGLHGKPYTVPATILYRCPSARKTITVPAGYRYDGATCAPNLRRADGERSNAFPVHDLGWERGTWDDGSPISFDRNNRNMVAILALEGFPGWILAKYEWGVSLPFMRRAWIKKHGHE